MLVSVFALKDFEELHLYVVTAGVSDRALGGDGHDKPIVDLGCPLFESADDILSNIAGEPLVHRAELWTEPLKLVDGHGANLDDAVRHEVLDPLLGGAELLTIGLGTRGVSNLAVGHEREQRTLAPSHGGSKRLHDLLGLFHGRGSSDLSGRGGIDCEKIRLQQCLVQRLGSASSNDDVLLVDEALLDFAFLEVSTAAVLVLDEDRALDEIPPAEDLLGP